jgi:glutathione S-transferase
MTLFHIPVCPFSQRLEILLALKGVRDRVAFHAVDITRPRPAWLLAKTAGSTTLPVLELEDGRVVRESLVLMRLLEERFPEPPVARGEPDLRAAEEAVVALEGPFVAAGYRLLLNQDPAQRAALHAALLAAYAGLDAALRRHGRGEGPFLFERFGWAEAVYTPMFMRFWTLEHYEGFALPAGEGFARVRRWQEACLAHPAAQQVTRREVLALYYDYARGAGNGALVPGRQVSSFTFTPPWAQRPLPPADKYGPGASDAALGLVAPAEAGVEVGGAHAGAGERAAPPR